ncbi:ABC transporter substrate-binding protein [Massilia sp. WF1]|uniref:acyclic terpene utilization AtuA family protein n=1 Tax=unclassified Massilia TaxID=2609279 RepID=UPI00064AEB12|nr:MULTISPECIES: acyclic terpene utilization AtuA family protein [unclassified Massilia]ALK98057.1 ABC transporter substrate-binding protein [Massilia sp. WG5]KLU35530.1 ABC transporter substrate-binding protein [Massilia sp. WF1]
MKQIRIGAGAGYSGDRIEPAIELAEKGGIDYLVFECLAERTIALAQQARMNDPALGYDPLLEQRMRAVLRTCSDKGIRIVTNMGAANPLAAAAKIRQVAQSLGLGKLRIAAVTGDDVLDQLRRGDYLDDTGAKVAALGDSLLSANAYLGAQPLVEALKQGADVIVTGRVADPALVLAPLIHEFGWAADDWERLGQGTLAGHLLECAGQVSGGYFADPGYKDVAGLARLGFPIGVVSEDGSLEITKVAGSGGAVTTATCTEQLLYEIHDPAAYLTPDVVADFSGVTMTQLGPDRVAVSGATGHPKSGMLKVSIGYIDSYVGEGQISYAGPGAVARARLAQDIVAERFRITGVQLEEVRFDLIGLNAIHGDGLAAQHPEPWEVRLRVAGRTGSMQEALRIGNEVETLYTCGPAGGGGATRAARQVVAVRSTLVPAAQVHASIHFEEL